MYIGIISYIHIYMVAISSQSEVNSRIFIWFHVGNIRNIRMYLGAIHTFENSVNSVVGRAIQSFGNLPGAPAQGYIIRRIMGESQNDSQFTPSLLSCSDKFELAPAVVIYSGYIFSPHVELVQLLYIFR